jgi:hypothetical protein
VRHESVTLASTSGLDWKGLGYLISIASVLFLGAIAWPNVDGPGWHLPVLIAGMATSIIGMACRYKAHRDQKREIKQTEAKADGAQKA